MRSRGGVVGQLASVCANVISIGVPSAAVYTPVLAVSRPERTAALNAA